MNIKKFSVVIFHDEKGNVLVQKRGKSSRNGEKYAFWGGEVEDKESSEDAIKRELYEELEYIPSVLKKCGEYEFIIRGEKIIYFVYLLPITEELFHLRVNEGEGMFLIHKNEIVQNRDFFQGDRNLISQLIQESTL